MTGVWDDDDFNWSGRHVVVPEQAAVAVYLNVTGQVVIRRQREWNEGDDTWVTVDPAHAITVARAILDAAGIDVANLFQTDECIAESPQSVGAPKDRTAAARQRRRRARDRDSTRDSHDTLNGAGNGHVTDDDRDGVTLFGKAPDA